MGNINDHLNRFYGVGDGKKPGFNELIKTTPGYNNETIKGAKAVSCYESHQPLEINSVKIWGGSCNYPMITDADIYIGFDQGMRMTARSWPWKVGEEFLFEIPDMGVPKSSDEFKKLVDWTAKQIVGGKKVHCGCIGGHGRTGMFLSALVCTMTGEKDAITYVRKNYCPKSVETASQNKFLADHFGIIPVEGSKGSTPHFVSGEKSKKGKYAGIEGGGNKQNVVAHIDGFSIWE